MRPVTSLSLGTLAASCVLFLACGGGGNSSGTSSTTTPTEPPPTSAPTATPVAGPKLEDLGLTVDKAAVDGVAQGKNPDPAAFATSFQTAAISVMARLAPAAEPGLRTAWLEIALKRQGTTVTRNAWPAAQGNWSIRPLAAGYQGVVPPGDYELVVTVLGSGDSKTIKFTIAGNPAGPTPAPVNFDDAVLVPNFGFATYDKPNLSVKTIAQASVATFKPGDSITVLFNSPDVTTGLVTATWRFQGKDLGPPTYPGRFQGSVSFAAFEYAHTPGDYEVTLSGPGAARTWKFTITPFETLDRKFGQVGMVQRPDAKAVPSASSFASTFDSWDPLALVFTVTGATGTKPYLSPYSYVLKYGGTEVDRGAWIVPLDTWFVASLSGLGLPLPAGSYEITVFDQGTGETKAVAFTVAGLVARTPTPRPGATSTRTPTPKPAGTGTPPATATAPKTKQ